MANPKFINPIRGRTVSPQAAQNLQLKLQKPLSNAERIITEEELASGLKATEKRKKDVKKL